MGAGVCRVGWGPGGHPRPELTPSPIDSWWLVDGVVSSLDSWWLLDLDVVGMLKWNDPKRTGSMPSPGIGIIYIRFRPTPSGLSPLLPYISL